MEQDENDYDREPMDRKQSGESFDYELLINAGLLVLKPLAVYM